MAELRSFLEEIAERQSSFVFFNNHIYDISDERVSEDFLEIAGTRLFLTPSMSAADFERLDEKANQAEIDSYCSRYIKEKIDTELRAESDISREKSRISALKFIMTEFLPYLLSKKYESGELVLRDLDEKEYEDPVERAREEIRDKLTKDFGEGDAGGAENPAEILRKRILNQEKLQISNGPISPFGNNVEYDEGSSSFLKEITGNTPIYFLYGKAFALRPVDNPEKSEAIFKLGPKIYAPYTPQSIDLSHISNVLNDRRRQMWRIKALERSQDVFDQIKNQIKTDKVAEGHMEKLARIEEYDLGQCGFILKGGEYFVFARIPKFATQDGRNPEVFWPFDSTRVAIRIGWNGDPYTHDYPYVIERRQFHPCLSNRTKAGGYCTICNLNGTGTVQKRAS